MILRVSASIVLSFGLGILGLAQFEKGMPLPRKAFFGAQLSPLSPEKAKTMKVSPASVEVARVIPGSSAEVMKLKVGDVILSLNGKKTPTVPEFMGLMRTMYAGKPLSTKVLRDGQNLELSGTSVERPMQKGDGFTVEYSQVLSQGKRIRVIATHPNGNGPFPTIFMIGGIGAYSTDGEFGSIAYGNILGQLAKEYAIIRTEKPGQGDSEGPIYSELLFDTELDAYVQSMRLTKSLRL